MSIDSPEWIVCPTCAEAVCIVTILHPLPPPPHTHTHIQTHKHTKRLQEIVHLVVNLSFVFYKWVIKMADITSQTSNIPQKGINGIVVK